MIHPWRRGIRRHKLLTAARQPDQRQDDGRAVGSKHDQGRRLDRGGDVEREPGEVERAGDRDEQDEPRRDDRD